MKNAKQFIGTRFTGREGRRYEIVDVKRWGRDMSHMITMAEETGKYPADFHVKRVLASGKLSSRTNVCYRSVKSGYMKKIF